jgi:hypothetical protein
MAAITWLVLALAACGGATAGTDRPSDQPAVKSSPSTPTEAPATPRLTDPPLEPLELVWESAGEPAPTGQFPSTYSPAVDPITGDIWVSVASDDVLWTFAQDGTFKGSFGKHGDGPGEFDFTRSTCTCPGAGALAFAPDGSLFVADVGNHRIQKFDPDHRFETEWGEFGAGDGQFADATQIATNGREVFVVDDARQDLQVFDLDGTFLRTVADAGWLAVDAAGNLFVSHGGTVTTYDPTGAPVDQMDLANYRGAAHIGLAVDAGGRLFFNHQDDASGQALALGELDPSTGESGVWSTAGETLGIAGDVLYEANYTGSGWPEAVLRAYRLPEP